MKSQAPARSPATRCSGVGLWAAMMRIGTLCPMRRSACSNRAASIPVMSGRSAASRIASGWKLRAHSTASAPVCTWTTAYRLRSSAPTSGCSARDAISTMGGAPGAMAMGSVSRLGNKRAGGAAPGARGQLEVTQAVSVAVMERCASATALLLGATRVAAAPTRDHIDDRGAASASREPPWPARRPEPSEVRDVSLPKLQQRGSDVLLEVLDAGGAWDREHDGRAVEQPRERDLGGGPDQPP